MHGFEAVGPMFIKFDSSRNNETHRDVIPSSCLTYLNTQAFRKFLQVVIFKLSSCDSSPPLEPVTGESSNDHRRVLLIQILFRKLLWVLEGEKK